MKKFILYCILLGVACPLSISAFDNETTHQNITNEAISNSILTSSPFLRDNFGFAFGTSTFIDRRSITEWLRYGSFKEDEPLFRASSHFHNPLRSWDKSGVRDLPLVFNLACIAAGYPPTSNIQWATGFLSTETKNATANAWDWDRARENYYIYLTGMDFDGNVVASSKQARESFLADSLRSLGQVLHLLQDMAVPAHVRDDFMSHWSETNHSDYYEYWVQTNPNSVRSTSPIRSGLTTQMVATFWDADTYTGQDPDLLSLNTLGLAEYTNMNFASKNTIFTETLPVSDVYHHPYPAKTSTNLPGHEQQGLLPETVRDKDGITIQVPYIRKTGDGEGFDHFVKPTYLTEHLKDMNAYETYYRSFVVDHACANDYASFLIPRAIGYSADLIDYFFRALDIWPGIELIHATADDVSTPVVKIKVWVKNGSPDAVIGDANLATNGQIMGIVHYKLSPAGETLYAVSSPREINPLDPNTVYPNLNSDFDLFTFNFSDSPIPSTATDFRFQVVYKGTIGGEKETAIAVGMLAPQQVIEIIPPDRFVYAITDGEIKPGKTEQEFTHIKLKAASFLSTPLAQGGQVTAHVYYRKWPGYRADLDPSVYPPTQGQLFTATSVPITLSSLLGKVPTEVTFDFSHTPIPVGITDCTLEVRYTNPQGVVTAWGMKDLFEPTHLSIVNSTDRFYLNHTLLTGEEIRNNYLAFVDFNRNGVPSECEAEEPYVDPLPLDIRFLFLSETSSKQPPFPMDDFLLTYLNVPAGRYVRVILLTGTPQFTTWVSGRVPEGIRPSDCPLNFSLTGSRYTSVKTQWDEEPSYTWPVPWRGIDQHYYDGITARAIPDGEGILDAGWSDVADPNPVPVTSIKP